MAMNIQWKKLLALFLAALLCAAAVPFVSGEEGLTKRVLVNVAQYKPVNAGSVHHDFPLANLVDGRRQDPSIVIPESYEGTEATGYADDWFAIDLLRRYRVERIELYDRYQVQDEGGRQFFHILGANSADFSDAVVLGGMGAQDDSIFPDDGPFVIDLNGMRAFRYIRLQRTGDGYYGYSELKVFARQTVTEVSRGMPAEASYSTVAGGYTYGPERAVNGTNTDPSDAWVAEGELQNYHFLTVDLGSAQHIGMIELEDRVDNANVSTRQANAIYGSNSKAEPETLTQEKYATEEMGYHKLTEIGEFWQYIGGESGAEFTFPKLADGVYREVCDDRQAYRYITFKKTYQLSAVLGQIRAYVVHPEVVSVTRDSQYLYVGFSDEMDFSTFGADSVLLRAQDGGDTGVAAQRHDAYTVRLDISNLDRQRSYTVSVNKNVRNEKGTAMAADYSERMDNLSQIAVSDITFHHSADGSGVPLTDLSGIETVSAKTTVQNFTEAEREVSLYLAQYSPNGRLLQINMDSKKVGNEATSLVTSLGFGGGMELDSALRAYVWDCTDDSLMPLCGEKKMKNKQVSFYLSPDGSDSGRGTFADPFRTLERAKQAVRERNSDMETDLNVYLTGGTYILDKPLILDENDGGKNGNYVNYKAYEGAEAVISGGKKITGWSVYDSNRNIFQADAQGLEGVYELYVNGTKARRAQSETRITPEAMYTEQGELRGVTVSTAQCGAYQNPQDIQLRYTRGWKSTVLNVETMEESNGQVVIKMQEPAFDIVTAVNADGKYQYDTFGISERNAFYIENAFELLDTPGEFYFDKAGGVLYYMADSGENMASAEVYVPCLERLLEIKGSSLASKVKNIRFEGITFAHANRADAGENYLGDQAQMHTPVDFPQSAYPLDRTIGGANVRVFAAEDISFIGNTFTGLSAVALGLYDGANRVTVEGNAFYDTGDSAITIGLPSDAYMEDLSDGRNVALFRNASASSQERYYMACYANDGSLSKGWNTTPVDGSYLNAWWQVDLGQPYAIDEIRIGRREHDDGSPYDQEVARRNFEVLGSNDPEFSQYVVLASQGAEPFDNDAGFRSAVTDTEKYRYVRVRKTADEYFFLSELAVISREDMTPVKEVCKNNTVSNNYITRVGGYNYGAPGIQTYYTEGANISHNHIVDVPYSGICIGWGWNATADSVTSKNNRVVHNRIENYAQRTFDAGGIYTLGQQPGSIISGNYVSGQVNGYGAFYPDSGSADYTVENNVFADVDVSYFMYTGGSRRDLIVRNNYSTPAGCETYGQNCTVEPPMEFLSWSVPSAAREIIDIAGLEAAYSTLAEKVPTADTALSAEEMYGNVIDEDDPAIDAILNPKFVKYYLDNRIGGAKTVLASGRELASAETSGDLEKAIAAAESLSANIPATGSLPIAENHAYRERVIRARIALIDSIRAFEADILSNGET